MAKCAIICVIITVIVLGGIAVLIAWAADRIKSPSFTIEDATVTGYNLTSDSRLNSTFTLDIRSHNRDPKYSVEYKAVAVVVNHGGLTLAYDNILGGPFMQDHGEDITFNARPTALNFQVTDSGVAGDLRSEAKEGQLNVEVRVRAYVRFEVKRWKHRRYTLKVICTPVVIGLTSSGKGFQKVACNVGRF